MRLCRKYLRRCRARCHPGNPSTPELDPLIVATVEVVRRLRRVIRKRAALGFRLHLTQTVTAAKGLSMAASAKHCWDAVKSIARLSGGTKWNSTKALPVLHGADGVPAREREISSIALEHLAKIGAAVICDPLDLVSAYNARSRSAANVDLRLEHVIDITSTELLLRQVKPCKATSDAAPPAFVARSAHTLARHPAWCFWLLPRV